MLQRKQNNAPLNEWHNIPFYPCLLQARKKTEKEADYQKFLKWKEEKLKKEIEQVILYVCFVNIYLQCRANL